MRKCYWVQGGVFVLPSYTRIKRGRGWITVVNVGRVNVKFKRQCLAKVAKVSYGREVTDRKSGEPRYRGGSVRRDACKV